MWLLEDFNVCPSDLHAFIAEEALLPYDCAVVSVSVSLDLCQDSNGALNPPSHDLTGSSYYPIVI